MAFNFEDNNSGFLDFSDEHCLTDDGYFAVDQKTKSFFKALLNDTFRDTDNDLIVCNPTN